MPVSTMKKIFDRVVFLLNWVSLFLCGLALVDFLIHPLARDFTYHSILYRVVSMLVLTPLTLLVGFLIIRRVPGNSVGPLLILWSGTVAYGSLRSEIGQLPFGLFAFYEVAVGWNALSFMLLHFPDGNVFPPRTAPWLYRVFGINFLLGILIHLSSPSNYGWVNPIFVPALEKYTNPILSLMILFGSVPMVMVPVTLVMRFRRGSPIERQQIKFLALFGAILAAGTILGFIVYPLITGSLMFNRADNLFSLVFFFSMSLFPSLAIGVAVLRYRLWDLDIIIRRTLVYTILTGILTLVYFGSVVLLQNLFTLFTKQVQPPIATVLSTLAIAALFTPFRRLIQTFIDQRFYRQKYDAEKVLAAFSTTLRNEVDLERLTASILEVVEKTMQPTVLSLRFRQPPGKGQTRRDI